MKINRRVTIELTEEEDKIIQNFLDFMDSIIDKSHDSRIILSINEICNKTEDFLKNYREN